MVASTSPVAMVGMPDARSIASASASALVAAIASGVSREAKMSAITTSFASVKAVEKESMSRLVREYMCGSKTAHSRRSGPTSWRAADSAARTSVG
jgi:hypothetical protein